jgi:hypothetical protein
MEAVCFFGNSIHTRLFGASGGEHNLNAFWIENEVIKIGGFGM